MAFNTLQTVSTAHATPDTSREKLLITHPIYFIIPSATKPTNAPRAEKPGSSRCNTDIIRVPKEENAAFTFSQAPINLLLSTPIKFSTSLTDIPLR